MDTVEVSQAIPHCALCGMELRFVRHVQGGRKQRLSLWMCASTVEPLHFYALVGKDPTF